MTNREHMNGLDNYEMGVFLRDEPWKDYADRVWEDGWTDYCKAIEMWLDEEYEEEY